MDDLGALQNAALGNVTFRIFRNAQGDVFVFPFTEISGRVDASAFPKAEILLSRKTTVEKRPLDLVIRAIIGQQTGFNNSCYY
jgi:hypothetical protein